MSKLIDRLERIQLRGNTHPKDAAALEETIAVLRRIDARVAAWRVEAAQARSGHGKIRTSGVRQCAREITEDMKVPSRWRKAK